MSLMSAFDQYAEELNHVLDDVLLLPADSPIRVGLLHFEVLCIHDLMSLDPATDLQDEFLYNPPSDGTGYMSKLSVMAIRKIHYLQLWHSENVGESSSADWLNLSATEFQRFSLNHSVLRTKQVEETAAIISQPSTPMATPLVSSPTASLAAPTSAKNSQIDMFTRSIKRSAADYNKFKDDSRWKQWHRHLKATANNHDIINILIPDYMPITPDDMAASISRRPKGVIPGGPRLRQSP